MSAGKPATTLARMINKITTGIITIPHARCKPIMISHMIAASERCRLTNPNPSWSDSITPTFSRAHTRQKNGLSSEIPRLTRIAARMSRKPRPMAATTLVTLTNTFPFVTATMANTTSPRRTKANAVITPGTLVIKSITKSRSAVRDQPSRIPSRTPRFSPVSS